MRRFFLLLTSFLIAARLFAQDLGGQWLAYEEGATDLNLL